MNGGWWEELFSFKKSNFLSDLSAAGKIPHSKNQKKRSRVYNRLASSNYDGRCVVLPRHLSVGSVVLQLIYVLLVVLHWFNCSFWS